MSEIVPHDRLGRIGEYVGSGGQSLGVFELLDHPRHLVKRYPPGAPVDPDGLLALVDWPATLPPRDQRVIDIATAWPLAATVFPDGLGVVVRRAPDVFFHVVEGKRCLRSLDFAYCQDAARFARLAPASLVAGITIVYRFAAVLDVAHRHGVVYGDVSGTNLLWSGGNRPRILVIDCDAAWRTDGPRAQLSAQTTLWDDPWPSDGSPAAERRRDLYKLALLFLRLYYRSQVPITDEITRLDLPTDPISSRELRALLQRGLSRDGVRPSAVEWMAPLVRLDRALRRRGAA